jgi:hypothetical protein
MKIMPAILALALASSVPSFADSTDLHALDYSKLESDGPVKSSYIPLLG